MKRAIFPLPLFILPQGYTRLRIFEPRYLNMVKNALQNEVSFVLCTFEHDTPFNISAQGCLVDIIDFDQDDNGMLLIDVRASQSVQINDEAIPTMYEDSLFNKTHFKIAAVAMKAEALKYEKSFITSRIKHYI